MIFVILPNQLFDLKYLDKDHEYIIWEHPHYFVDYNFNKKKLILHRASMRYYFDLLLKNKFNVKYVEFDQKFKEKEFHLFDPVNKLETLKLDKHDCTIIDTPNFLLTNADYDEYREKTKNFFFNYFYMWSKKKLDIIPSVKSLDKMNRKKMPKNVKIPELPKNVNDKKEQDYIDEAKEYVEKNFKNNYGNTENFVFPITHDTAKKWLKYFIKYKFNKFGDYQDYIDKEHEFLFHSVLSSSINIGILNPGEIIEDIEKIKDSIAINSYEGYVRQLFWREYQRLCYKYYNFKNKNYFGNKKKLTKDWYLGTLGIPPVDDAIKTAFDTGYLHHINRLMVVGNFMNLSEIHPMEGLKWFMEFAIDSYEWVMYQNVLDMVFFVTGGDTMRRPYMSSSNYVLKMSNYSRGEWCDEWDKAYYDFIKKNKNNLHKYRYFIRIK